jgi:hypothetical protein
VFLACQLPAEAPAIAPNGTQIHSPPQRHEIEVPHPNVDLIVTTTPTVKVFASGTAYPRLSKDRAKRLRKFVVTGKVCQKFRKTGGNTQIGKLRESSDITQSNYPLRTVHFCHAEN